MGSLLSTPEKVSHEPALPKHSPRDLPKAPEKPWRKIHSTDFEETAEYLRRKLKEHKDTRLNIVLIGHTGAGKSSLINSIFSISRRRMVDKVKVRSEVQGVVGTYHFQALKARPADLFQQIYFYDTMGFTSRLEDDEGIKYEDLKAVCEGRVPVGHKFNSEALLTEPAKENRPHCVIFVVSARVIDQLRPSDDMVIQEKLKLLDQVVPYDIARLVVMTKLDQVCDDTFHDIQQIYSSKRVHALAKKAERALGVQENRVFPIVNLVSQVELDEKMSVPILYALKSALDFAKDRAEEDEDDD